MSRYVSPFFLFHVALLVALLLSLTVVADVHAFGRRVPQVPSWYLGVSGSVNFVSDASLDGHGGVAPLRGTLEYEKGYGITGALGYRTRNTGTAWDNLRFEAEIGDHVNNLNLFTSNTGTITSLSDDLQVQTAMFNMFIDFDMAPGWRPYIGGGIGGARLKLASSNLAIDDEDTALAYQGMAGIYYTPSAFQAAEFGIGYRYLGTGNAKFTSSVTGSRTEMNYGAQSVEAGARFYF